jgi:Zn-dependent peptidase ImmA (M78 family)/DNA-binding XRE family transcriptional regulator
MNDARFNPDMLRLARDLRGVTQAELASMSGVTQALISKMENGLVAQPSDEVIVSICAALRFPPAFFDQPERLIGLPHFHARERSRLNAHDLASITATINLYRQHVTKLIRSYEVEIEKPIRQIDLDESGLTPEKIANRLREYWMLPRGPIANLVEIIEDAGGIVIQTRFQTNIMPAISFRSEGLPPLFFIKRDISADNFRLILAQELGHLVMHNLPEDEDKMTVEANRFAAEFLMPAVDIKPYLAEVKLSTLGRLKAFWKVSIRALLDRAFDLKMITAYQFRSLYSQYNKAYREGEPIELEPERPRHLRQIAQFHIQRLGYSMADLATLLCMHEDEVRVAYTERPRLELIASTS